MSNKLYVGNLPYQTTEEDLRSTFGEYGEVTSAKVITDFETGRSKGFAFVELSSAEEAQNAISSLDGNDFNGRTMRVSVAKDRPQGGGRGNGGGNRRF